MIRKFIISSLLYSAFSVASPLRAQEIFKFNSSGGGFNLFTGFQNFNYSSFYGKDSANIEYASDTLSTKNQIASSTFPRSSGAMRLFGFQGYGLYNSILMGGEFNFGIGAGNSGSQDSVNLITNKRTNYGTTLNRSMAANLMFDIGLIALRKKGLIVYPIIGAGWGGTGMLLQAKNTPRVYPSITGVVTTPNLQNVFIWTNNAVFDFGLGVNYYIGRSTEDNAKGFSIGVRAGYNMQLGSNNIKINAFQNASGNPEWTNKNTKLPDIGNSGFYVKALIGFGRVGENL